MIILNCEMPKKVGRHSFMMIFDQFMSMVMTEIDKKFEQFQPTSLSFTRKAAGKSIVSTALLHDKDEEKHDKKSIFSHVILIMNL